MNDLHDLTATEQLHALRTREVSSHELTRHYLERIDGLGTELGAFVTLVPETALAAAADADARIARGESSALLGLPLGIKDLQATVGIRTTFGSAAFADVVPPADAWTVGLLRGAGAVVVGKTNAPELGATCYTENSVTERPAVTPYDPSRYSSGSSGGSATAVSAGLPPVAHASDSAGSTRTPAAACHLVGVKPSRGLVSSAPATTFVSVGSEGLLARTVADAALLLDVMAQPAPGDLYGSTPPTRFADAARPGPVRPLTIATWTETGLEHVETDPEAARAVRSTARLLRDLGHEVREIPIPARLDEPVRQALAAWFASTVGFGVTALVPQERHDLLQPFTRHLADVTAGMSADDALRAQAVLARYASAFLAALDDVDVALTPTTGAPPVPVGHYLADGVEGVLDRMLAWSCHTPWANFTGQPAVSLPAGRTAAGLPLGVQLVGRRRHDAELFAVAAQIEAAAPWGDVHPECWYR